MSRLSRRRFGIRLLQGVSALGFPTPSWAQAAGQAAANKPVIRSFDLSLLDDWLTPNELFFVREHLPAPTLSSAEWSLSIVGAVQRSLAIGYEDLLGEPQADLAVTLECAGNPTDGGLVSNARWTGTSLGLLLEKAQLKPEAKFVRLWGSDKDAEQGRHYYRSIPLMKALHKDTLLAHGMNGQTLPADHGFPLRAVIPGWYGMDSVKWLQRVEVLSSEDTTPLMRQVYMRQQMGAGGSVSFSPLGAMQVKSVFARPVDGAVLVGRQFKVRGAAWAGERRVQKVEVSTDEGRSWHPAQLLDQESATDQQYAWTFWEYPWEIPDKGQYVLLVRATDDLGRVQPSERSTDRLDPNELNHYQRVRCTVV